MIFVILSTRSDRDIEVGHAGFCGLQKDVDVVCAADAGFTQALFCFNTFECWTSMKAQMRYYIELLPFTLFVL